MALKSAVFTLSITRLRLEIDIIYYELVKAIINCGPLLSFSLLLVVVMLVILVHSLHLVLSFKKKRNQPKVWLNPINNKIIYITYYY